MEHISIPEILAQVAKGQIRVPAFQRGYVWEPDRVAYLMDSIYKRYPFGSLLFWRTKEKLLVERDLGPFKLPEPREDYPVDYVLDGQQRITSIFGTFQTSLPAGSSPTWTDIYFDTEAEDSAQDTLFVALSPAEAAGTRYFPIRTLFDPAEFRRATSTLPEEKVRRIDLVYTAFQQTQIPVQVSKTEDKATVAIIFERVNRQGVELDTLQLLSAWTWSEDFQLQEAFKDLTEELSPFGFEGVGGDSNLLLRCCSAVLTGDASPGALMSLNGNKVRENFQTVMNGVRYAVDYVRANFAAESIANLPFTTVLVPLSVFFAVPGNSEATISDSQRKQINQWFWRSAFTKRYSSGVLRSLNVDIEEMRLLREQGTSNLGNFSADVKKEFFMENSFGMGNVNTKTFILMLATRGPLSFKSGIAVDLAKTLKASNRAEYHHLMPKAFLRSSGQDTHDEGILANYAFLSRADNRALGGDPPSVYKTKMPVDHAEILERALVPPELFNDDYNDFVVRRAQLLMGYARTLCRLPPLPPLPPSAPLV
ncbi:GmrSD restriction endonuclease domain-containing protein [Stenotrophomonas rhizophila]|uniref:GmrSD restriction endonuclease domain-containing protein n=1 Tax=Stenotrophomonas rhizophila TaxID=216778 RepID=UPI0011A23B2B|nr:DUF262 domain-containing protein [Stenotrophomonas rhizophila]